MSEPLTKVDSAVQGIDVAPKEVKETKHRRASSSAAGVMNINDLGKWCPPSPPWPGSPEHPAISDPDLRVHRDPGN